MWSLELTKFEVKKLEKFLLRFKEKYGPLTISQVEAILNKNEEAKVSILFNTICRRMPQIWLIWFTTI